MKLRHKTKMYPPRIKMTISMTNSDFTSTLPIKFEGCTDNSLLDVNLTIPIECLSSSSSPSFRNSSSSGSSRRSSGSQSQHSTSDTPRFKDVLKQLFGLASHWKIIGGLLGLESQLLDKIKSDEEGVLGCFTENVVRVAEAG